MAEGGDRLAVLNRSERLAEEKERVLRECAPTAALRANNSQTLCSLPMQRTEELLACRVVVMEHCASTPGTALSAGTALQAHRVLAVRQVAGPNSSMPPAQAHPEEQGAPAQPRGGAQQPAPLHTADVRLAAAGHHAASAQD